MLHAIGQWVVDAGRGLQDWFGAGWRDLGQLLTLLRYGWLAAWGIELPLVSVLGTLVLGLGAMWMFVDTVGRTGNAGLAAAWAFALVVYTMLVGAGLKIVATSLDGLGKLIFGAVMLLAAHLFETEFVARIAASL